MDPSKDWKEEVAADENERFERYATGLADLQKRRARNGATSRALHAKAHAGLRAELEILPDLPDYARVALFAEPKTYKAYVRFSNGTGARVADHKPDVRGLAVKLLGVGGRKIISGMEKATTQDFLFINSPAFAFSSVDDFVFFVHASSSPALLPLRLFQRFGFGTFGLLKRLMASARKVTSLATETYYTAAAIRFGEYAVRLSLLPKQRDVPATLGSGASPLHDDLAARLKKGEIAWDLRAQFFVNPNVTPIEEISHAWSETDAPHIALARLTIPEQDVNSADAKAAAELVETLAFDPWHACEEFRPLGAVMRARNPAYRESQKTRETAPEPTP